MFNGSTSESTMYPATNDLWVNASEPVTYTWGGFWHATPINDDRKARRAAMRRQMR